MTTPSVTFWARLEPRARDATMDQALQAQVRDPLWFLARQWQVGEFSGHDRGSPVQAALAATSIPLSAYRPALTEPGSITLDTGLPLEAHVEREAVTLGLRASVQLGLLFEQLIHAQPKISRSNVRTLIRLFRGAYQISATSAADAPEIFAQELRLLASGRVTDGAALYAAAKPVAPNLPAAPAINPNQPNLVTAATDAVAAFVTYCDSLYTQPATNSAWVPQQLEHQFSLGATDGTTQFDLEAPDFSGGDLDWFSFTLGTSPLASSTAKTDRAQFAFVPNHIHFRGMPQPSWWLMEDGRIDLGSLDTATTDPAKMLVIEFALIYGNDWFELPLRLPVGTLNSVEALVVTDTFGERTAINSTSSLARAGAEPWSMFSLTNADANTDLLLLVPTLVDVLESDPVEQVLFMRDEMAAMAWGIEQIIEGALDRGVNGYEAWLQSVAQSATPASAPPGEAPIQYLVGTSVPGNWLPLVPVQSSIRTFLFRRGIMGTPGAPPARGEILQPGRPLYIADEAIPRVGTQVRRHFRRVRWSDGTTWTWIGRQRQVGRGEGSSGLAFDVIEPNTAQSAG
jgi:hypothetical protein